MSETSPALETAASESTPAADPIDSLDVGSIWDDTGTGTEPGLPNGISELGAQRSEEETDPAAPAREDGRDEQGRFTAKDPKDPTAATETPDPNAPSPFTYRALGQTHAWDGVIQNPDGSVTVPPDKVGDLRATLNARKLFEGEGLPLIEKHKATIAQQAARLQQRSAADVQAEKLVEAVSEILGAPDDEAFITQMYQLREAFPMLKSNAERDYYKTLATSGARPETAQPDRQQESNTLPTPADAWETTRAHLGQYEQDEQYRDVRPETWQQIETSLQRTPLAFLRPVTAEEAGRFGLRPGEIAFDTDAFHEHVMATVQQEKSARESARAAAKVAASNATRTQPSINTPPAPRGNAAPAPAGKARAFANKEEFDDWMNSDEL